MAMIGAALLVVVLPVLGAALVGSLIYLGILCARAFFLWMYGDHPIERPW